MKRKILLSIITLLCLFIVGMVCFAPTPNSYRTVVSDPNTRGISFSESNSKKNINPIGLHSGGSDSRGVSSYSESGSQRDELFSGASSGTNFLVEKTNSSSASYSGGSELNSSRFTRRNGESSSFASDYNGLLAFANTNLKTGGGSGRNGGSEKESLLATNDNDPFGNENQPMLAPPGGGDHTGGVPLGDGLFIIITLSLIFTFYRCFNMKKLKRKLCYLPSLLLTAICLLLSETAQAQNLIPEARSVNRFVTDANTGATVDVLKMSELGACNAQSITIQLLGEEPGKTVKGGTAFVNSYNRIQYTPPSPDFVGQDLFQYILICGETESHNIGTVILNVNGQPDNIVWDACFLDPRPIEWGMNGSHTNEFNHCTYQNAIVGDLDSDGIVEIVVASNVEGGMGTTIDGVYRPASSISVYKGNDLSAPYSVFNTRFLFSWTSYTKYSIVKTIVEGQGEMGLILVAEGDFYLRAYDIDGNLIWESDEVFGNTAGITPTIGDLNNDGIPEIIIAGRIFDSSTGRLITSRTDTGVVMVVADMLGTGKLNCLAGNKGYEAITDEDNNILYLQESLYLATPTITNADPDYTSEDSYKVSGGGTSLVADIDNDGELDLIVIRTRNGSSVLYVGNPRTNQIIATKYIPDVTFTSYPFVGDIDGDGNAEIVLIKVGLEKNIFAFKYNPDSPDKILEEFWRLPHLDGSGSTGITLFDFDMDGKAELVYRDETQLRIIDGSTNPPTDKAFIENLSDTGMEYPTIADIDNDGQAEILIVGGHSDIPGTTSISGSLWVYKSFDPEGSPWAWARPVWNQYCYNPVYINDDLTTVNTPISPAAAFITKDGNTHRPYNNFLQQATLLDNQGLMFRYGPDLTFDPNEGSAGVTYTTTGTDLEITIYVLNQGDDTFVKPLQISAYATDSWVFTRLASQSYDIAIDKGDTEVITMIIPWSDLTAAGVTDPYTGLQLRLNEQDSTIPHGDEECLYYNNYYPAKTYTDTYGVGCEYDEVTLSMYPQDGTYTYKWYEVPEDGTAVHEGNSYTIIKDSYTVQHLYVEVYRDGNLVNTDSRRALTIYLYPDELVWTGAAQDQDWHNPVNWYEPAGVTPQAFRIPRKCTHVLIPDGLDYYADLSKTIYTTYDTAECADIRFEFGGEVARTDLLDYDRAFVQYNFGYYETGEEDIVVKEGFVENRTPSHLKRDRYYALSIPLKKVVTGDFSVGGYPAVWQMKYADEEIDGSNFAGFTKPYNSLGTPFNEEQLYATALWVAGDNDHWGESRNKNSFDYQQNMDGLEGIIEIPFFEDVQLDDYHRIHEYDADEEESTIHYYWQDREFYPISTSHTPAVVERGADAYRFIFDGAVNTDHEFTISVPAGREVMLGNPSMSTMNFDAFFASNSTLIENYYRLFEGESFQTYAPISNKTTPIAPQQAIFIETIGTAGEAVDLVYPFETASVTRATGTDHAMKSSNILYNVLTIEAEQASHRSSITLVLNEEDKQNIDQLFYLYAENTPQLYLLDQNDQRNAVQFEGKEQRSIPLGVYYEESGNITLNFKNVRNLTVESLVLIDTKTGIETDLFQEGSYLFEHQSGKSYDDRFILKVGAQKKDVTVIRPVEDSAIVTVYASDNELVITSDQLITRVELYDLQGRLLDSHSAVNKTSTQLSVSHSGVYLVQVSLLSGER
ncbi:FG-GAP-like repeat-containing protein, partial [Bacteroidales bacterium OttesenSCG-928-M11]|nr:FG-GAP-like repeat-containing protein [Bacteroidales bacterium OttesenSCG-928-M11]